MVWNKGIGKKYSKEMIFCACGCGQRIKKYDSLSRERKFVKGLTRRGIKFRKHEPILGQPDIFIEPNICVFADGCRFHGCHQCVDMNKFNKEMGQQAMSIRKKMIIDPIITMKLQEQGFIVLRFWEHRINVDVSGCVDEIEKLIKNEKTNEVY